MDQYDVVVIGSGPAGEGAAMMLAKHHRRVAVVERYHEVGGGCTHWGTIPSKALRHAVKTIADVRKHPLLRKLTADFRVTMPQLLSTAGGVIDAQVQMRRNFYERNRVPVLEGAASFVDANTLQILSSTGEPSEVSAERFVIATGSRPYHPPGLDFSHPRVLDSDSVLRYTETPFGMTIYGAGVIGCEYASIFLNMGVKVTLVNTHERLLSFMAEEIAEALSYHLRDPGCIIRHSEQFDHVEARADDGVLHLQSGRSINVTPIARWELIVGKLLPYALLGMVDVLIVVAVAIGWFEVPLRGSPALLLLMCVVYLLTTLGLGLFVSTISATQQQAMMTASFFFLIPMVFLSGFVFPIENMPAAIQPVTYVIPLRYFLEILRGIFLKGVGLEVLWPQALALLGWGVGILVLATMRSSKRLA
jgi:thioredoxin reductase